ncbi:PR domain zinc finger protein 8 isoform X1 [Oncorhynchus tshawytscha]|uniref:SET domain-containing protein n=2 Tax=Oncorhynchus tshawytscha TaxID=74940 RepID=A0AAZ3RFK8_ONCTS|nr:PR domain zinc finger protein 8 isoform X1 [Oncorhynchus tshawytscha]
MDRRTAPYILRRPVSIWLHRQTPQRIDGPMWLRLVQSAWSAEEQNLEHYVKNGHLFFRALRTIQKEEERLVWYGKDLAKLLLLNPLQIQSKGTGLYTCANCNQCFETEFCTQRQPNSHSTKPGQGNTDHVKPDSLPAAAFKQSRPETIPLDSKPATDFHNLARDMDNIKTGSSSTRDSETRGSLIGKHTEVEDRCSEPASGDNAGSTGHRILYFDHEKTTQPSLLSPVQ